MAALPKVNTCTTAVAIHNGRKMNDVKYISAQVFYGKLDQSFGVRYSPMSKPINSNFSVHDKLHLYVSHSPGSNSLSSTLYVKRVNSPSEEWTPVAFSRKTLRLDCFSRNFELCQEGNYKHNLIVHMDSVEEWIIFNQMLHYQGFTQMSPQQMQRLPTEQIRILSSVVIPDYINE